MKKDDLHSISIIDLLLATLAAPTYFPSIELELGTTTDPKIEYVFFESFEKKDYKKEKIILEDGGVKANNPSRLGYEYV